MNHRYLRNVATLELDAARCTGCGKCVEVCPHQVLRIEAGNGRKASILNKDRCMECGACAKNCPPAAVTVRAGVGCAAAIVKSMFTGGEPTCGCGEAAGGSACCG
jgi:ferredoxin